MDAHMIAKNIIWGLLGNTGIELIAELPLNGLQERLRRPAMLEKKIL
jgi:hypothetical protein